MILQGQSDADQQQNNNAQPQIFVSSEQFNDQIKMQQQNTNIMQTKQVKSKKQQKREQKAASQHMSQQSVQDSNWTQANIENHNNYIELSIKNEQNSQKQFKQEQKSIKNTQNPNQNMKILKSKNKNSKKYQSFDDQIQIQNQIYETQILRQKLSVSQLQIYRYNQNQQRNNCIKATVYIILSAIGAGALIAAVIVLGKW